MSTGNPEVVEALRTTLKERDRLRRENTLLRAGASEPIAVVGMACRYPGGISSPDELWRLVDEGRDGVTGFPTDRGWDVEGIYNPDPDNPGTSYTREGGFIHDAADFDAEFFSISPREALFMNPQERLLLESSWEALEDAGIDPASLRRTQTGVFAGVTSHDYGPAAGGTQSLVSGRVAYTLGLEGPAITVDTACSSSLVAIHLASQALRQGECTLALVGGVTTLATPGVFVAFSAQRGLAADGRCKSFADAADGTGWAEGVGMLVVERLSDAQRNGHAVLSLLKGSAVNQDGASNGLTAPNGPSQERVIRQALASAGLEPKDVDAVEAHGTGTTLGDPIEARALLATYGQDRDEPLRLGSIKSNIGHSQAASGVAGVIKMTEAMRHGILPKTLHVDAPSSKVDWGSGRVELLTEPIEWRRDGAPRRAGVSSFGVSGTNAHVIVEEPPRADQAEETPEEPVLRPLPTIVPLALSAKAEPALAEAGERLAAHLEANPDLDPADIAHSLVAARSTFEHRAVAVGSDREGLLASLRALGRGEADPGLARGSARAEQAPVFLFPGQGAQTAGMALGLIESSPAFAEHMAECERALAPHVEWSLAEILREEDARWLDRLDVVQPALFAVMVSLAKLWRRCGVEPWAVVGHSQGEIAAAHVAGALSLEDAALVVAERGKAMVKIAGEGGMLSVSLGTEELAPYMQPLGERVSLAAVNGPRSLVLSGDPQALDEIRAACERDEVRAQRIAVDYAAHSAQIEALREDLLAAFAPIAPRGGDIPLYSTVSGEQIDTAELGPEYWYRNLRETVLLEPVLRSLLEGGRRAFIEIGPHPVLAFGVAETFEEMPGDPGETILLSTLRRDEDEARCFARSLGEAHAGGIAVDRDAFFGAGRAGRVPLPTYPFQRKRYWVPPTATAVGTDAGAIGLTPAGHPMLAAAIEDPAGDGVVLAGRISLATHPWLADHAVGGSVLLPGTGFLELALRAAAEVDAESVEELTLRAPLVVPEAGAVALQVTLGGPDDEGRREISIYSRPEGEEWGEWAQNASGVLSPHPAPAPERLDEWPPPGAEPIEVDHLYDTLADAGLEYGNVFQGLAAAWRDGDRICVEVSLPEESAHDAQGFGVHPALLDAALHGIGLARGGAGGVELPFSWAGVALHAEGAEALRVSLTPEGERFSLRIADSGGAPVATVGSLALRAPAADPQAPGSSGRLLALEWKETALPEQEGVPEGVELLRPELGGDSPAEAAREAAQWALREVQSRLAGEEDSRLALVTEGAMATRAEDPSDPVAASIWGLVRSAQSEHPGRFALIDSDGTEASEGALPAALAMSAWESQLVLREGTAFVPRVGRVAAGSAEEEPAPAFDPERTVLVTGATGVLGALTAVHLAERHGARHLLLASRSGAGAEGADALKARLEDLGAEATIVACDVSDREALEALLASIPGEHPLGAVVHSAGALADGTVESLEPEQVERVFTPKADPAWSLHELTRDLDLSAFVLFSSAAGTLGTPGQGNYAAANVFLDALAQRRRAEGLVATSIAWGLWESNSAMTSHLDEADRTRMRRSGAEALSDEDGLALLDEALATGRAQTLAIPLDLGSLRGLAAAGALPPIFSGLVRVPRRRRGATGSLASKLATLPEAEHVEHVLELVRGEVAGVLGHASGQDVEPTRAFKELGFDSLGALELRNRLSAATGQRLSATVVFDYPNAAALAEHLLAEASVGGGSAQVAVRAQASEEPVAIVGMACRYPGGVSSPEDLWRLVAEGRDGIAGFPADRGWDLERLYDPDPEHLGTTYTREGGFIEGAGEFDPEFFSISPREALIVDPQQRLLLESCWEALEEAGIDPASLKKSPTGVFAGVMYQDYGPAAGMTSSIVSGRVAYTLGLEGPAITVDTACSSSLVAMHLAAQALRQGECTLALAGGVTVLSTPTVFVEFSRQRGLAADGRSKSFAEAADGAGFSEGVGMLVLERLSDAERSGHPVLALLKGSAVNQDGASNGLTAPNGPSQERVIRQALANARLEAKDVDAVEAHGTGTTLGDPIEAGALLATYGQERERPLRLGSIKSNIGHTQAAAGVAGVIKMTEAIRRGVLPKTLHVDAPSSKVEWESGEIELLTEQVEWEANGGPRRAGVSSFGVSGTNAHVILEEAPRVEAIPEEKTEDADGGEAKETRPLPGVVPLALSTKAEPALPALAERLLAHLQANPDLDPTDVAYSLLTTRSSFEHRAVVMGSDREELLANLEALAEGTHSEAIAKGNARTTHQPVFLFPGQGAQAAGMATGLIESSPTFAHHIAECERALAPHVEWSLTEVLGEEDARWLDRLDVVQPALFAVMVSLARLWEHCGVRPRALVGHSQGEIAAAHIAGALSLEDAALLIAHRGKAMAKIAGKGGMLSVSLPPEALTPYTEPLGERVSLAAINGPASLVLSGDPDALEEIREACERDEVRAQRIAVDYAAHSSQIEDLREELLEAFAPISPQATTIPLHSTVTAEQIEGAQLGPEHWYRNLRQTVLLEPVLRSLLDSGRRAFIEIGPHPVLAFGATETFEDSLQDPTEAILLGTLRREEDEARRFGLSLAEAHANGIEVDWDAFFKGARPKRVPLPTYPFQRQRYWLASTQGAASDPSASGQASADHPLLGAAVEDPTGEGLTLTGRISLATQPWLADHAVNGAALLPATAFLELALRAAEEVGARSVEELTMLSPLVLSGDGAVNLQVTVAGPDEQGRREIAIHSQPADGQGEWTRNAGGALSGQPVAVAEPLPTWPPEGAEPIEVDHLYDTLAEIGVEYGPVFQGLTAAWTDGEQVYAEISLSEESAYEAQDFGIHPALLDAALQASVPGKLDDPGRGAGFPFAWRGVELVAAGARHGRVRLRVAGESVTLQVDDSTGAPLLAVESLVFRASDSSQPGSGVRGHGGLLGLEWVEVPLPDQAESPAGVELLDCGPGSGATTAEAARAAATGALEAVQRSLAGESEAESRMALVTAGAMAVLDGEAPDPTGAAIWGLVRSAQSEHPGRFALIDSDGTEASVEALPGALAAGAAEPQLALREGRALVPRLARLGPAEGAVAIDPERTVLVTGDGDGVGALVARHLEERHGVRHVLLCEATDREALKGRLESIDPEHPLGAVVHCAGEPVGGLVESLDGERIDRVFGPKADPAWDLHELSADLNLSAFVLFSSMAGTLGSPGQADYAAASAFLDALAQQRRAQGLPATSIAWGLWEHQIAAAGVGEADLARMRRGGVGALSDEHGLALLDAALASDRATALALALDTRSLRALAAAGNLPPVFSGLVRAPRRRNAASGSLAAKLATLPETEAESFVLDLVRGEVAAVLGYASAREVAPEKAFQELGFDSLGAVELRNRLSETSGVRLRATAVFDYPSAAALAEHLLGEATASGDARQVAIRARASEEPIAIVGMACRYPGDVSSPEDLWELVAEGRDAIAEFPGDRGWDLQRIYDPAGETPGTSRAREGGFLATAADFDAGFFGISPREALLMDPQERILLESCWEALEDAGVDPASLRRTATGVFAGVAYQDYGMSPVTTSSIVSGRISYTLGLEGPAMTVNTACSSSLVAMHLASQALRQGECTLALAGGVTTLATPELFIDFSRQGGLAADGRSKSFAEAADGAGFSEGVGVLVLERLSEAQRAGHTVLAVLRGSAVNQDGASNGLTAPNGPSQERVIRQALANAGLQPADVDAVEAHGTGTTLGDPIEAGALLATYGQERDRPLKLGSLKSNIGHAQAAAGVGGVIKMVMAMRAGMLPKTLHVDRPSTKVDWEMGEIELLIEPALWRADGGPRRAGVSSFGVSGTNAHVIVEEPPASSPDASQRTPVRGPLPLVLSGRTEPALREIASRLASRIEESPDLEPADVAYSLATARPSFERRAVVLGEEREDLIGGLRALGRGEGATNLVSATARGGRLAFLFSGQGSQRPGMGRELYDADPAFADAFDRVCEQIDPQLGESLRGIVFADGEEAAARLENTAYAQPALFATEVALHRALASRGLKPDLLAGHSIGELAAAHVAGVFSLADAARLVCARGRLMSALPAGGAMLAVAVGESEAMSSIAGGEAEIALAAINSPTSVVLSGTAAAIAAAEAEWEAKGRKTRRLAVSHAFHSPLIEPMLDEFAGVAATLEYHEPQIPIVSGRSGEILDGSEATDPAYWVAQVREPVRFAAAVAALGERGADAFLEIGPDPVLCAMARETLAVEGGGEQATVIPTLREGRPEPAAVASALAAAYACGAKLDWGSFFRGSGARRVPLPTYPFQRERYWLSPLSAVADVGSAGLSDPDHPLLGAAIDAPGGDGHTLTGRISTSRQPWLADHSVFGMPVLPGAAFLELALHVAQAVGARQVEELTLEAPLALPEGSGVLLQVVVERGEEGRWRISIHSRPEGGEDDAGEAPAWTLHAAGELSAEPPAVPGPREEWPPEGAEPLDLDPLYDRLADLGLDLGPAFQGDSTAWRLGEEIFAELSVADAQREEAVRWGIHPVLLELAQATAGLAGDEERELVLPTAWSGVALEAGGAQELRLRLRHDGEAGVELTLWDRAGAPLGRVGSLRRRPFAAGEIGMRRRPDTLFALDWAEAALSPPVGAEAEVEVLRCETGGAAAGAEGAREAALTALEAVQGWLADEARAGSRLALVTTGALPPAGESPDLAAAAIWGLVRTAQSEHPGRFALIDSDGSEASEEALPSALAGTGEEAQIALREGVALVPRLIRAPATGDDGGERALLFDPERTVLVTGATGGLGPMVARHLVAAHGVRHLLLTSRSGSGADGAAELRAELEALGAEVRIEACDASRRDELEALLGSIPAERPLGAVVHVAGALADGTIERLGEDDLRSVFGPKADAAWHLHELTRDAGLSAFVTFSSAVGVLGGPGQANYAAANAFLDALAQRRQAEGLAATSIAWGAWAEGRGMAGGLGSAERKRMERSGMAALSAERGLALLDAALAGEGAAPVAIQIQVQGLRSLASVGLLPPILSGLVRTPRRRAAEASSALLEHLASLSEGEREEALLGLVRSQVAAVLGHESVEAIEPGRAFQELGFDSLAAVELRNNLAMATGMTLQPTLVFDYPTSESLAAHLLAEATAGGAAKQVAVRAQASEEPIAIVGMACRYPGGISSPEGLWELVASGRDAIGEFPTDRGWDVQKIYNPDPDNPGTSYTREGGFLAGAGEFDADFFSISPREAVIMDPQERLLLESSWEALEGAGIEPSTLSQTPTGVFAGVAFNDYEPAAGGTVSIISGRVAYALGLEGPAITVDTACSSSLVAMHLASQALRSGECTLALAGGVTVLSTPTNFIHLSAQRALSADGRCKAFADAADGTGWGEGVGMLVLERLSDARRNGHSILAVIKGSAVNQDGASNGLTAPNGPSQERVIRQALANAGLQSADVDAVEAHGTGTTLGDPIEAGALLATYGQERDKPLKLGSLKSNIGHAQAAAGVGGVIKMTEAMRRGVLPRTLHVDAPSSKVDWGAGLIELLTERVRWEANGHPRRAGVSSFGISGTNAHLILEEAPPLGSGVIEGDMTPEESDSPATRLLSGPVLLPLSAKAEPALAAVAARLANHLRENPELDLADVSCSLATARAAFKHRAVALGNDRDELLSALGEIAKGGHGTGVARGIARKERRPVFVFPGQGSQWTGMALDLLEASPPFATKLRACEEALSSHVAWSVEDVLRGIEGAPSIERIEVVQPVLFAVMASLAELWRSRGVRPAAVIGHSQGEIVAAHVSGGLSLEDAAMLAAVRSGIIAKLVGRGGMMSIGLPAAELEPRLARWEGRIEVAAHNGPSSTIVSGDREALDQLLEQCVHEDVRAREVPAAIPSHSAYVEELRDEVMEALAPISPRSGEIPFHSTVTGERLDTAELDAGYWYRNLRETVRFEQATRGLLEQGHRVFVEVSPHPIFALPMGETIGDALSDPTEAVVLGTLRRNEDGPRRFALSLAQAHAAGSALDWEAFFAGSGAKTVKLPTYPFQKTHYWLSSLTAAADAGAVGLVAVDHPMLGARAELAGGQGEGMLLTGRISSQTHPWVTDHAVSGSTLLPGTAFVEMALTAGEQVDMPSLEELTLLAPLILPASGAVTLQVMASARDEDGQRQVSIYSRPEVGEEGLPGVEWTHHAEGILTARPAPIAEVPQAWPPDEARPLEIEHFYDGLAGIGVEYGPAFQGLTAAWKDTERIYAEVSLSEEQLHEAGRFGIHPALLDSALHGSMLAASGGEDSGIRLPFSWRGVSLTTSGASALRVCISSDEGGISLQMTDADGRSVAVVDSLTARPLDPAQLHAPEPGAEGLAEIEWTEMAAGGSSDPAIQVEVRRCETESESGMPAAARRAVLAALEDVQQWLSDESKAESRLALITRGAMAVGDGEAPDPAVAAVWGLIRAAQAEHPGRFSLIDVDGTEASEEALPALLAIGAEEPQLALRVGTALAPRVIRMKEAAGLEASRPIDPERTILITGGTGALGALTARHLVERRGARRLLLVSRGGPDAEGAGELRRELEDLGAQVSVVSCDVADRAALERTLAQIPDSSPLGAVIHCAGVLADGTVEAMGPEQIESTFAPKVDPAWSLHELTTGLELSAFVLFSSAAGVFGNAGQANYAAANTFLDALAEKRRVEGLAATSIAWGFWERQSSMRAHLEEADLARMRRGGVEALSDEQGLLLLEEALGTDRAAVLAAPFDPAGLRALASAGILPPILSGLVRVPRRRRAAEGSFAAKLAGLPEAERAERVFDLVRMEAAFVLGHDSADAVEPDRPFRDLGFDSLGAVELRNRLNLAFELSLPATVVFDHPTSAALATHLLGLTKGSAGEPPPPRSMFAWLRRQGNDEASTAGLIDLIASAATLRETFDDDSLPPDPPEAELLADGPGLPKLILLPSIMPTSGPAEYAQLAEQFRGERQVLALEAPGFREGEPLPAGTAQALRAQADAVQRLDLSSEFVLVGHSSGGWFAQGAAADLELAGTPPEAVILIDTFFPPDGPRLEFRPEFLAKMWIDQSLVPVEDVRLTATMFYLQTFLGWLPPRIESPVTEIRPTESLADLPRSEPGGTVGSAAPIVVPGDHFSMMATHAATTARAIREAIGLDETDEQPEKG